MKVSENQAKQDTFLKLLDAGLVMVHLDPRLDGVVVPKEFKDDHVLRLNIAYGFNLPALDVDEEGIYAVLSFYGRDFGCTLPWDAIFAMTMPDEEDEGALWPLSLPEEWKDGFAGASEALAQAQDLAESDEPPATAPTTLRVVDGGMSDEPPEAVSTEEDESDPDIEEPSASRPHLRIVKG